MEMKTTNNSSYKYWIGSLNDTSLKNSSNCLMNRKNQIDHQTTYNFCYTEPGKYSKGSKIVSDQEKLCIEECCRKIIHQ